jgi:PAS domain S-box-containing protein
MENPIKILMLEDSMEDAEVIQRLLSREIAGLQFEQATSREQFLLALDRFGPSIVLADNSIFHFNARQALEIVRQRPIGIPFIMVTGTISEEFATDIIKAGADDYILKDRLNRLPNSILAAITNKRNENEREIAMEKIRQSDERFQTLSMATKDALWDWNLVTGEIWWNENLYRLLGFTQQLLAPSLSDWIGRVHPFDRGKIISKWNRIKEHQILSWEDEFRFLQADGSYGTVLDRGYVLKDESGTPIRVIGALVDITQQKNVIREMEVLSLIAKETSSSVMIFDKATGIISWVNEGFVRNTGYSLQESLGKTPWELLGGLKTDKNSVNMINTYIRNDSPFSCDLLIYTRKRKPKWQFMSGHAIPNENGIRADYFIISTDISERKIMEEERIINKIERQREVARVILQSQEIERNALGRELHDNIGQMLAAVNLELSHYQKYPDNNIGVIKKCRLMLAGAMKEARDLSHGMVMPRFTQDSLKDELEGLFACFDSSINVCLDFEKMNEITIPTAIKETIYRIAQVQLHNIGKHSKATEVAMRITNDPDGVKIMVCDNGIGFDTTQKRKGIGITNIYTRVESYNGTANFSSKPGDGCLLSVTIPLPAGKEKRKKRFQLVS